MKYIFKSFVFHCYASLAEYRLCCQPKIHKCKVRCIKYNIMHSTVYVVVPRAVLYMFSKLTQKIEAPIWTSIKQTQSASCKSIAELGRSTVDVRAIWKIFVHMPKIEVKSETTTQHNLIIFSRGSNHIENIYKQNKRKTPVNNTRLKLATGWTLSGLHSSFTKRSTQVWATARERFGRDTRRLVYGVPWWILGSCL